MLRWLIISVKSKPRASVTERASLLVKQRGINLLREWLSPEQRAQFDAKKYFDVIGCDSGKRYRIHYGDTTNVQEIGDDDLPSVGWCFMPVGSLVAGDVMLAQKIALETYEYRALAVANRSLIRFSRFS